MRRTIVLVCGAVSLASTISVARAQLGATATIASQQSSPGSYHYDITLNDTGSTSVGTFWFAWIAYPQEDLLPDSPTTVSSPPGWSYSITHVYNYYGYGPPDGYGIEWTSYAAPAMSGQSLTGFGFDSPDSPAQIAANSPYYSNTPANESVVYSGGPFSDGGFQLAATSAPVPEPSAAIAILIPVAPWLIRRKRR